VRRAILPLSLTFLLAACGQGTGTGASGGSTSSTSASDSTGFSLSRLLDTGKAAKATVSMPASALIVDAMRQWLAEDGWQPAQAREFHIMATSFDPKSFTPVSAAEVTAKAATEKATPEQYREAVAGLNAAIKASPIVAPAFRAKLRCAEKGAAGKADEALACYTDASTRALAALAIVNAHAARSGWEINPNRDKRELVHAYLDYNAATAEFASLLEAELAAGLAARTLRDPDDAKARIIEAMIAMPIDKIKAAAEQAVQIARENNRQITLDMVSMKGIGWTAGGSFYLGDSKGWTITRNGVTWFGDGKVNGKAYELGLESSISMRQSKSSTTGSDSSAGSGTSSGGQAQVR
jgi:hypothetical protein